MSCKVYTLASVSTGEVFYVGRTENAPRRFRQHLELTLSKPDRVLSQKIRTIYRSGDRMMMEVVQVFIDQIDARYLKRKLICKHAKTVTNRQWNVRQGYPPEYENKYY